MRVGWRRYRWVHRAYASEVHHATPCKPKDLRTDSLAVKIGLFEGIFTRCNELGLRLEIASYIPDGLVTEIRRLNTIRNGFSHESAKSDAQAQLLIEEAYPLLREVFVDLADLGEVELVRLRNIKPGSPPAAEVERLVGHAQSKRVRSLPLLDNFASVALAATPVDGFDRVLAKIGPKLVDLCPYFLLSMTRRDIARVSCSLSATRMASGIWKWLANLCQFIDPRDLTRPKWRGSTRFLTSIL